ncbi:MAG: prolyl oligopeptidase family serine peptidase [Ignavibacteriaceae bacterium]
MKNFICCSVIFSFLFMASVLPQLKRPPFAEKKIKIKEYHGVKIEDPYSYLQNIEDPYVKNWINEQAEYGRKFLDHLPNREKLKEMVKRALSIENEVVGSFRERNNKYYYKKTKLPDNQGKLYVREKGSDTEKVLFDPVQYNSSSGNKYDINKIEISKDGRLILLDLFPMDGSEINDAVIINSETEKVLSDTLKKIEGWPAFLPDGSGIIYMKAKIENGKKINSDFIISLHEIGSAQKADKDIFSMKNNPELNLSPNDWLWVEPEFLYDYSFGFAWGVTYGDIYITHTSSLKYDKASWKKIFDKSDKILSLWIYNKSLYVLSQRNSLNGEILKTSFENPDLSNAEVIVPPSSINITETYLADNKLYLSGRDVMKGVLSYVDLNEDEQVVHSINIPYPGIASLWQYTDQKGVYYNLNSWNYPSKEFYFDPALNKSKEIQLVNQKMDLSFLDDYEVEEIEFKARDGVMVPLSLIHKKDMKKNGNNFVDLYGYGSYGASIDPFFIGLKLPLLQEGVVLAYAHVRGGGEKGEVWHLAGMKQTKSNTWKDFIDCAEYLIQNKITSKGKIACRGTSAGGILVGRAITERPDLFKVAVPMVGCLNALVFEDTPNGTWNVNEFGTYKDPDEFKSLLEMDAYHHIQEGVQYPAQLITSGANDSRVAEWVPVKFYAKMIAANSSNLPVILKLEYKGGHWSNGFDEEVNDAIDVIGFVLSQLGVPGYKLEKITTN